MLLLFRLQSVCKVPTLRHLLIVSAICCLIQANAAAQSRGPNRIYYPLDHMTPPGTAAEWSARISRSRAGYAQPIRVQLPGEGRVTWFDGGPSRPVPMAAPALAGLVVGNTYRVKISHMPEYPGLELYPSIEVLDRLHPPEGLKHNFPIPIYFTREEIDIALGGNLVTRVIYLEQPQLALPRALDEESRRMKVTPELNLLAEADRLGRPMLIIRLGGRLPDSHGNDTAFYGSRARVFASKPLKNVKTEPETTK